MDMQLAVANMHTFFNNVPACMYMLIDASLTTGGWAMHAASARYLYLQHAEANECRLGVTYLVITSK